MSLHQADKILVLLGAGASYEAGIPTSPRMIRSLEELLEPQQKLEKYRDLYNFEKSAIYFADGIKGSFDARVNYNIERLVNTLSELIREVDNPLGYDLARMCFSVTID